MSSIPSQTAAQAAQHNRSVEQQASFSDTPQGNSSQQHRRSSIPQSTTSEDSQTVLLEHPSSSESSVKPEEGPDQAKTAANANAPQKPLAPEPKKCWICFADETEDSPTSSDWRSPCPCELKAHEACLLDWVADLEAPNKHRLGSPKIECPQCKATISISRPRNIIVEAVQDVENRYLRLLTPFSIVTLAGTVITGCWMHGFCTIYMLFGQADADRLFGIDTGVGISSEWGLAMPFIPIALICSRKTFADNYLPLLPIVYFAANAPQRQSSLWPPSAAMTVAFLPYIRGIYNAFYKNVLKPKELDWIREVQPRAGENESEDAAQPDDEPAEQIIAEGMNLELGVGVVIDEEVEGVPQRNAPGEGQNPGNQDQPRPHPHNHLLPQPQNQGINIEISAIDLADTVVGALLLPTISTAMGAVLKLALPRKWTTPPSRWDRYPVGFLQSRFGRSVAGGFLFVVLKDTLHLYSKYRLASDHRRRKIVDYKGKRRATSAS